jgi:hypothetical protein
MENISLHVSLYGLPRVLTKWMDGGVESWRESFERKFEGSVSLEEELLPTNEQAIGQDFWHILMPTAYRNA